MPSQPSIAAIILAAGTSSRMGNGRHKLLLPLAGQPVLAHVLAAAQASQAHPVIVVLGHQATHVRASLPPSTSQPALQFIVNPRYAEGMSTSLHTGIQALLTQQQTLGTTCQGTLVLLGDQPLITSQMLNQLIATKQATGKAIIAPVYAGKRGNPVLFDASLFSELLQITGDEGGRSVVQRHQEDLATLEINSTHAWYDVDTWEAYQQVVTTWKQTQTERE